MLLGVSLACEFFHEQLREVHGIVFSYSWKAALQTTGLVKRRKKPGSHRKRRPRRALTGMMLRIDGSDHRWFSDERRRKLMSTQRFRLSRAENYTCDQDRRPP